ncbi:hypothetical protein PHYSODRAFT_340408 [Phytophthora sojae]|uniref:Crinkler (CRN) family protein n=1 Tax=Phytophthora sojae (strain P6497) TaxID=1094619 RepID=G5A9M1_PHYSP|nr:hypothetical protein PHYSODRAFT_340408 [Phytophthora sojae]EGZ07301.1 hypothetical protein PHYSODRAFT_340408 [Phytophthora sojae]|eukprot:XP_009536867.1 hypothetical protein PHYSODRAFT_340408 [Phytophthora sojae]
MSRKVWFQLVDNTGLPFKGCRPASVQSDGVRDIEDVRAKIHAAYDRFPPLGKDVLTHIPPNWLKIYESRKGYADENSAPLDEDASLDMRGGSVKDALIVEVPKTDPIPPATPLKDQEKIAQECSSLDDWSIGTVHEIPAISRFMSQLGGCTETGKIFWRLEDKQVVSLIMDGWFRKSTPDNRNAFANKTSILIGSPGIGKSTLLCLMAFYLVFKHKKNVFLYRRGFGPKKGNSLLYMTHDAGQVVYFAIPLCADTRANKIYKALARKIGAENVWGLLDGFPLDQIRRGVWEFKMLATSQQADLKSLYKFEEDEMETRFYYSGGSFALVTVARNLEQPMEKMEVQHGGAVREWKDISAFTYWVPDCDDFPNIDSIVKLKAKASSGKKSNVVYLQITGAKKHEIRRSELTKLNDIFFPDDAKQAGDTDPPLYIALCSSLAARKEFMLTSDPEVLAAQQACSDQVYVGYYEEVHSRWL